MTIIRLAFLARKLPKPFGLMIPGILHDSQTLWLLSTYLLLLVFTLEFSGVILHYFFGVTISLMYRVITLFLTILHIIGMG